jgi:hypothetical protein
MKRLLLLPTLLLATWLGAQSTSSLEQDFRRPPDAARPWVYWIFMDGNMTREGMTADLEAMHRAGIGGVIMFEVDLGLPRGPVKFMTPEWQELFAHAVREAERLGIEIALCSGPGWCGTGGPWVRPEDSMQHLVASETHVLGPQKFNGTLPRPQPRRPYFGEGTLTPELAKQWREFHRDVAVLAIPVRRSQLYLTDIEGKALYQRAPYSSQPGIKPHFPTAAEYPPTPAAMAVAPARDHRSDLPPPAGRPPRLGCAARGMDHPPLRPHRHRPDHAARARRRPRLRDRQVQPRGHPGSFRAFSRPVAQGTRLRAQAGWRPDDAPFRQLGDERAELVGGFRRRIPPAPRLRSAALSARDDRPRRRQRGADRALPLGPAPDRPGTRHHQPRDPAQDPRPAARAELLDRALRHEPQRRPEPRRRRRCAHGRVLVARRGPSARHLLDRHQL